ncbi:MAG: hypothetical protein ABJ018_13155, partial [Paracoccaceae bacterium]
DSVQPEKKTVRTSEEQEKVSHPFGLLGKRPNGPTEQGTNTTASDGRWTPPKMDVDTPLLLARNSVLVSWHAQEKDTFRVDSAGDAQDFRMDPNTIFFFHNGHGNEECPRPASFRSARSHALWRE